MFAWLGISRRDDDDDDDDDDDGDPHQSPPVPVKLGSRAQATVNTIYRLCPGSVVGGLALQP